MMNPLALVKAQKYENPSKFLKNKIKKLQK